MIFSLVSWVAIYFVIWWTALFVVLPFVGRKPSEADATSPGVDPGAPASPGMRRVVLITTLLSAGIFLCVMWVLTQTRFGLDDVPLLPKFEQL